MEKNMDEIEEGVPLPKAIYLGIAGGIVAGLLPVFFGFGRKSEIIQFFVIFIATIPAKTLFKRLISAIASVIAFGVVYTILKN